MADPFISREDLSDRLGEDVTASDKALQCVDAACDTVRMIAEQTFNAVEDDMIVLDGTGTDALLLPELPVRAVDSVMEDGVALAAGTDYKLNGKGVLLRMPPDAGSWSCGRQNVEVQYDHGYEDATFPRDVRMVALEIAERMYSQSAGVTSESLGKYSRSYESLPGLADDVRWRLRKYKR